MLLLAVLLLLAAVGLLIATLVTGQVTLAWGSVGISAVAAMALLVRRRRSRRRLAGDGPDEERTDAADLLVVSELSDQVLVVDEHPRYHLAGCPYPDAARAERLPVREARELGFTPCAQCKPDAALAGRHRAESTT